MYNQLEEDEQVAEQQKLKSSNKFKWGMLMLVFLIGVGVGAGILVVSHFFSNQNKDHATMFNFLKYAVLKSSATSSGELSTTDSNLLFYDDFDTFNMSRWKHIISAYGGGNWEFEYYTNNRSNSYVNNSVLYIKPTLTNNTFTDPSFLTSGTLDLWGSSPADSCTANLNYGCFRVGTASNIINPIQSARIRTAESFSFKYGKVQVRAQLPLGDWLWPAIWMVPKYNAYGDWPASGEIDIIESRGNYKLLTNNPDFPDGSDIGVSQMGTTLHWGPYYGADPYWMTHNVTRFTNGSLWSDNFHVWTLEWSASGFTVDVDGTQYFNHPTPSQGWWKYGQFTTKYPGSFNPWTSGGTDAPFDQEFYIVINLAVGGTSGYWPPGSTSVKKDGTTYPKPWLDTSSTALLDFWNQRAQWYPTWKPFSGNGTTAALKVDWIKVYKSQ